MIESEISMQEKIKELISKLIPIKCRLYECENFIHDDKEELPECSVSLKGYIISHVKEQNRNDCPFFIEKKGE